MHINLVRSLRTGLAVAATFVASSIASSALAAGTTAGTTVSNQFTLDYSVGGVAQTQIDNAASPTNFVVDRIINLTVTSQGDTNVSPGESGATLVYSVLHSGNDNQRFEYILEQPTSDDFDVTFGGTPLTWYTDDGDGIFEPGGDDGAGTTVAQSTSIGADIAPDTLLWVEVDSNIPAGATDTQASDVTLVANTLDPATWIVDGASGSADAETVGDADGNAIGATENVLADADGPASAANDTANDGAHSDTGTYNVVSANLAASKTVAVLATNATSVACAAAATLPPTDTTFYPVPGACVEYVITVVNSGAAAATAITLADALPDEITFVSNAQTVFTGGTLSTTPVTCTAASSPCTVTLAGATLAAGSTGTLTIRGLVE